MLSLFFPEDEFPAVPPDRLKAPGDQSPLRYILAKQRSWAVRRGMPLEGSQGDHRGAQVYCQRLEDNLFLNGLTPQTRREFERGDGHELGSKMKALHSSSAFVANAFDYWRSIDDFERVVLPKPSSAFPATGPGRSSSASLCGSCPWAARS